jgi:hypothetical protein
MLLANLKTSCFYILKKFPPALILFFLSFFFGGGTGVLTQGLMLEPLCQPFFEIVSQGTICQRLTLNGFLLISAS